MSKCRILIAPMASGSASAQAVYVCQEHTWAFAHGLPKPHICPLGMIEERIDAVDATLGRVLQRLAEVERVD